MTQSIANQVRYLAVVKTELGSSTEHSLKDGRSLFVGASPHCGIQLQGTDIAKMHFLLSLDDGVISIQDWSSPTGTFVNGSPIDGKVAITENDQVSFGGAMLAIRTVQASQDLIGDSKSDQDSSAAEHHTRSTSAAQIDADLDEDEDSIADEDSPWNADFDYPSVTESWEIETAGSTQYDQETVDLLKAEIDDLRSMLAERDSQIEELSLPGVTSSHAHQSTDVDGQSVALQQRIDNLLAEASEHDERFAIVHDLLEAAELKNQAEADERQAFEAWVGEIEHRIGQRESEWQAQLASVRERLQATAKQRDQLQHQLREVASRFGAQDVYRDTLDKLQAQNSELQDNLEIARSQSAQLEQQLDNLRTREAEAIQQERALIAKERASVSRLRFELSRKLSEFEQTTELQNPVDQEVALRMQTLRSHLREIHEQEQQQREQKGESLFTRISGLWKRVDDEY